MSWLKGALFGHKVFKWWRRNQVGKRILGKELTSEQIEYEVTERSMDSVQGVIRHILTTLGGGLVTTGVVSEAELQTVAGAVAIVIGVVWSVWQKKKAAKQ